jgi:hypothetical protein
LNIQESFDEYHRNNPTIYRLIIKYALEAKSSGYPHYSINGIFERIRWHINIESDGSKFKLNNNYRSRYVRLIETYYPELRGFFRMRELLAT